MKLLLLLLTTRFISAEIGLTKAIDSFEVTWIDLMGEKILFNLDQFYVSLGYECEYCPPIPSQGENIRREDIFNLDQLSQT